MDLKVTGRTVSPYPQQAKKPLTFNTPHTSGVQISSTAEFEYDKESPAVVKRFECLDNVCMIQFLENGHYVGEINGIANPVRGEVADRLSSMTCVPSFFSSRTNVGVVQRSRWIDLSA